MKYQPQGYILKADENGEFVKAVSYDTISDFWKENLDEIVRDLHPRNPGRITSVYVRGSVAGNHTVSHFSDIDLLLITDTDEPVDAPKRYYKDGVTYRLDIGNTSLEVLNRKRSKQFTFKTQAVCIDGDDITEQLPAFYASIETARLLKPGPAEEIQYFKENIANHPEKLHRHISWIMRFVVRDGGLVSVPDGFYTRDLVHNYNFFVEQYPEHSERMYHALDQTINPSWTAKEAQEFLDDFGLWLDGELKQRFCISTSS